MGSDVRQFSKNIAGRAMVCTSVLSVVPQEIAFGNCNIGAYARAFAVSFLPDLGAGGERGRERRIEGGGQGRRRMDAPRAVVFGGRRPRCAE